MFVAFITKILLATFIGCVKDQQIAFKPDELAGQSSAGITQVIGTPRWPKLCGKPIGPWMAWLQSAQLLSGVLTILWMGRSVCLLSKWQIWQGDLAVYEGKRLLIWEMKGIYYIYIVFTRVENLWCFKTRTELYCVWSLADAAACWLCHSVFRSLSKPRAKVHGPLDFYFCEISSPPVTKDATKEGYEFFAGWNIETTVPNS